MDFENFAKLFTENLKTISYCIAFVLFIAGGVAFFNEQQKAKEQEAMDKLYSVKTQIETMDEAQKLNTGVQSLLDLQSEFSSQRAAKESQLAIGDIYFAAKKYDQAANAYQKAAESYEEDFMRVMAIYNQSKAQELSNKCQEAIGSIDKAVKIKAGAFLLPEFKMAKARCLEKLKNFQAAVDLYQQIQDEFPQEAFYSGAAAIYKAKLQKLIKN